MRLRRFRLRRLMIAVAVVAFALWIAAAIRDFYFTPEPFGREITMVWLVIILPPTVFLATCAALLVRYRNL